MATYRARLVPEPDGGWIAASVEIPNTWSRGRTSEEAIEKLRSEIRYRIELCPCSGVADDFVQIEVQPGKPARAAEVNADAATRAGLSTAHRSETKWQAARPADPAHFRGIAGCPPVRRAAESSAAVPSTAVPSTSLPSAPGPNPSPIRRRLQSRWPD